MLEINLGTIVLNQIAGGFGTQGASTNVSPSRLFCGPDDDSCVYFGVYIPPGPQSNINIYVVDKSGAYTFYSPPFPSLMAPGGNHYQISEIIPFSRKLFLMTLTSGATYWLTLQNLKLNNTSPIPIFPSNSPLFSPCPALTPDPAIRTYYDPLSQYLIGGYYQAAGQTGTDIFSNCFKVNENNGVLQQIAGGFVGSTNNGSADPFDKTSSSNTGWYSSSVGYQTNGVVTVTGLKNVNDANYSLGSQSYNINPGINVPCNGTPNGAYVTLRDSSIWYSDISSGQNYGLCDFSIPYFGGAFFGPQFRIFGTNLVYLLNLQVYNPYIGGIVDLSNSNVAVTAKNIFAIWDGNFAIDHIVAIPNPGTLIGSTAHRQNAYFAVNSVRPVSVTGAYKS